MENPSLIPLPPAVARGETAEAEDDLLGRFDVAYLQIVRQGQWDNKRCRSEALRLFPAEEAESIKAAWYAREERRRKASLERRQAEEERDRQERLQRFMGTVGPRLAHATLDGFVLHGQADHRQAQRQALAIVRGYLAHLQENVKAGRNLWFRGSVGTGKDMLAVAIGKEGIVRHGLTVVRITGAELFRTMRAAMHHNTEAATLLKFMRPRVLILSDPAPPVGELTTFQAQVLFELADARNADCRPTWTTLNAASNAEADCRLTPAIADRLRHDAVEIECVWPSWRTEVEAGE